MKKKLTIRQRIKACFILLFGNSTLSYVFDLEERCKKANFAPFSLRIPQEGEYFVWDKETIQNAENWLKQNHPGEQLLHSAASSFLSSVFRSIDSVWIGITYMVTTLVFGFVSIIEKNWLVLIGGLSAITFIVVCACIRIAWSVFVQNKIKLAAENSNEQQSQPLIMVDVIKSKWLALSEDEKNIMGRPNFTCAKIADKMRGMGFNIARKAEDEQALVIWAMLQFYKEFGKNWSDKMNEFLKNG